MPELAETKTEAAPVAAADPVARIEDDDDDESDDTIPDLEDAGKLFSLNFKPMLVNCDKGILL